LQSFGRKNVPRIRTTKKLAQRIDLNYFKRPTPLKRAKLFLSVLAPAIALAWVAWLVFAKDTRVYSSGRMSETHAVLANHCAACHVQKAGLFQQKTADSACLACHDGPLHHHVAIKQVACSECHDEHRGRVNLLAASNTNCTQCHSDLKAAGGTSNYANAIESFGDGHPEFAALRASSGAPPSDHGTLKLDHALHMKSIRRGPRGPMVQLACGNCHRPAAAPADMTYGDPHYRDASTSYHPSNELLPVRGETLSRRNAASGRELMAPVKFATACASCHLLTFDKRFDEGVPHDKPDVVHQFLISKFTHYIAAHPAEVRVMPDPDRDLAEKIPAPAVRVLTPAQWVAERTADAEQLLWRKTCLQCHALSVGGNAVAPAVATPAATLPVVAPANTTVQWMPHAKFDHQSHEGFTCTSCHEKALTSTLTTDVLMPGIATCQTCHAPGPDHAESRCFECHSYHDWSKRREISPTFTLPSLLHGTR
jgi:predicted CXXCH cytochrome family protein